MKKLPFGKLVFSVAMKFDHISYSINTWNPKANHLQIDGNGETTIFYIKIWFIIPLKQPFINGWPWGSRYPTTVNWSLLPAIGSLVHLLGAPMCLDQQKKQTAKWQGESFLTLKKKKLYNIYII